MTTFRARAMSGIYECEISGDRVLLKRPDGRLPLLSMPAVTFDVLFTTRTEDQPMQTGIGDNKSTLETDKPHLPEIAAQWRTEFDKYMADRDERIRAEERERIGKILGGMVGIDNVLLAEICNAIAPQSSPEAIAREVCKAFGLMLDNFIERDNAFEVYFYHESGTRMLSVELPKSGDLRANLLQMLKPWAVKA